MFAEPFLENSSQVTDPAGFPQQFAPYHNPDVSLKQQIEDRLADHPHFRGRRNCINVRVRGGVVRVEGCLPSWYLKQLLQEAVGRIPGVKRVSNHTSVRDWSQIRVGNF